MQKYCNQSPSSLAIVRLMSFECNEIKTIPSYEHELVQADRLKHICTSPTSLSTHTTYTPSIHELGMLYVHVAAWPTRTPQSHSSSQSHMYSASCISILVQRPLCTTTSACSGHKCNLLYTILSHWQGSFRRPGYSCIVDIGSFSLNPMHSYKINHSLSLRLLRRGIVRC